MAHMAVQDVAFLEIIGKKLVIWSLKKKRLYNAKSNDESYVINEFLFF